MTQNTIIGLFLEGIQQRGEIRESRQEQKAFSAIIDYLITEGFIEERLGSDRHFMKLESLVVDYYNAVLSTGFKHGFKTALSLVGRNTKQIGEAVAELLEG